MSARTPLLAVLLLFACGACSPGPDDSASRTDPGSSSEAEAEIDSVMARYIAAVEQGDTAAIAATLTDDVEIVFPTGPMLKGRAEVVGGFADMLATTTISELRPANARRTFSGDLAVETGSFSITVQPKGTSGGAGTTTDRGYYMVVWERQSDGSWKMARGFNRADAPLADAATAGGASAR